MKSIITTLVFIVISFSVSANNYYFAKSGSNTNSGTNSNQPWRTFSKLGSITLLPGDTIFINGGDTIRGQLNVVQSGTANHPIVFTSFGNGKGIISGAEVVNNWTKVGTTTIYTASFFGSIKSFFINHKEQTLARYPNEHQYLQVDSAQLSYLKDADLITLPTNYFTNTKVCVHTAQWCWEKTGIQNLTSNKLNYTSSLTLAALQKYGYFLYDNINLLDTIGEWQYSTSTGVLNYFSNNSFNPNNAYCEVSEYSNGINFIGSQSYVSISNLVFDKQTNAGIMIGSGCKNVVISNCEFYRQYNYGVQIMGKNHIINNSIFQQIDGHGIDIGSSKSEIHHNNFKNIGQFRNGGIGGQTNLSAIAVNFVDSNYLHHNIIDSTGYCGISSDGNGNIIERNIASHCMLLNNDGAPFKAFGNLSKNQIFKNNFALNTFGNKEGTYNGQFKTPAFYFDNYTQSCTLENNTSYNVPGTGIFLNAASHDNIVKGNVIYGGDFCLNINGSQQMPAPITGGEVKHNVFFALQNNDVCFRQVDYTNAFNFGSNDSNYLWQGFDTTHVGFRIVGTTPTFYNFKNWQAITNGDLHSKNAFVNLNVSTFTSTLLMNQTDNISKINLGDTIYLDLDSNIVCGNIDLPPFTSKVLLNTHQHIFCAFGVNDLMDINPTFNLYPNPCGQILNIDALQKIDNYSIEIFDVVGKIYKVIVSNYKTELNINVADLNAGLYFIKCNNFVKKFVKE
ncbi:MAG: hypothetical protein RL708_2345 [Bacteroidota bacterium]|jgi:hypothetical protein